MGEVTDTTGDRQRSRQIAPRSLTLDGRQGFIQGHGIGGVGVAYLGWVVGALAALGLGGTALAQPQPTPQSSPPPLEAYGRLPTITSLSLSPSGERLASVGDVNGKRMVLVRTLTGTVLFASPVGNDKVRFIEWTRTGSEFESTLLLYQAACAAFGSSAARRAPATSCRWPATREDGNERGQDPRRQHLRGQR